MPAPPAKTSISGTPTNAAANAGFAAFWDYVTGLLGLTGDAVDARTALGAAKSGAITGSGLTMATARFIARLAGGAGAPEEITGAQALSLLPLRSYISGLEMSTAGSSSTMTVGAGLAADSGGSTLMSLAASIAKTTSAWAVGAAQGGLDTGGIANNTWYHWYLMRRPDTGVVDVCCSLSASAPTTGGNIPAAYTQFRRIGSGRTNGAGQWILFSQNGDEFLWASPVIDVDAVNPGTAAVSRTLTTPTGVVTNALLTVGINGSTTGANAAYFSSLSVNDQASQAVTTAALALPATIGTNGVASSWCFAPATIRTNTSSQIRSRLAVSGATDRIGVITTGWVDQRGRLA